MIANLILGIALVAMGAGHAYQGWRYRHDFMPNTMLSVFCSLLGFVLGALFLFS